MSPPRGEGARASRHVTPAVYASAWRNEHSREGAFRVVELHDLRL